MSSASLGNAESLPKYYRRDLHLQYEEREKHIKEIQAMLRYQYNTKGLGEMRKGDRGRMWLLFDLSILGHQG